MLGIGGTELFVIVLFAFLLFGPDKLPQMGRTIGRALRQFRTTQEKMTAVVQSEVLDPMQSAMNAPATPKKAAAIAATVDDDDLDADASEAPSEKPARKETFAERRARLAAEKEAAEKEAASAEEASSDEPSSAGDEAPAAGPAQAAEEPSSDEAAEAAKEPSAQEAPRHRTAADLYARRPKKSAPAESEDAPAAGDPGSQDADETGEEDAE